MNPLTRASSLKARLGALVGISVFVATLVATIGATNRVMPWLVIPVAVGVALIVTQWLAAGMTAPLREMTAAARRMARGDYTATVTATGRDEVATLAQAFNAMSSELRDVDTHRRELVATVSHELRTPAAALRALLENMADGVTPADDAGLRAALAQSERLSDLLGDLLALSRIDAGLVELRLEPVPVRSLLDEAVADLALSGRRVPVTIAVEPPDLRVGAERARVKQAVTNLLDNAARHTAPGTTVRVQARATGGDWHLDVADDGPGIDPEDRERIFERYGTASAGGTGLGLAVTRWVAEVHGGRVAAIDPEPGRGGALVRLTLPTEPPARPRRAPLPARPAGPALAAAPARSDPWAPGPSARVENPATPPAPPTTHAAHTHGESAGAATGGPDTAGIAAAAPIPHEPVPHEPPRPAGSRGPHTPPQPDPHPVPPGTPPRVLELTRGAVMPTPTPLSGPGGEPPPASARAAEAEANPGAAPPVRAVITAPGAGRPLPPVTGASQPGAPVPHNPYNPRGPYAPPPPLLDGLFGTLWPDDQVGGRPRLLFAAAAVGLLAAILLPDRDLGLALSLVLIAGGLTIATALPRRTPLTWACLALAVGLAVIPTLRDAEWLVPLSLLAGALLVVVALTPGGRLISLVASALAWPLAGLRGLPWLGRMLSSGRSSGRSWWPVVRTVVLSLLALAVFGGLFASADAVFGHWVDVVVPDLRVDTAVQRIFILLGVGGITLAAVYLALNPLSQDALRPPPPRVLARAWEWLVPVVLVIVMYAGFILAQTSAWLGGHEYVQRATGLTYAEYVHQGFGQLTLATILTVLVVAVAARKAAREEASDRVLLRVALGTLCVLTLAVVASALWRMHLYQDAFGYTTLRLVVDAFEFWVGLLVLFLMIAGIRMSGAWVPRAAILSGAALVLGLGLMNPEAYVAAANIERQQATGKLDTHYLSTLSEDAIPVIAQRLTGQERDCLLDSAAARRLDLGNVGTESADPLEFNLGRQRATSHLASATPGTTDSCAAILAGPWD